MSDLNMYELESQAVIGAHMLAETENGYGFANDGDVRVRVHYSRKTDEFCTYRNHILDERYRCDWDAHHEHINVDGWLNEPV